MAEFFRQDPSYIPISARIKYNLTSSELLRNDRVYLENATKCASVIDTTQKLLRKYTFHVVQREVWAAKQHLLRKYIDHGLTVTQMILVYERFQQKNKYSLIPYTDGYLAKVAFYNYIFTDLNNITQYLNCDFNQLTNLLQIRKNLSQGSNGTRNTTNSHNLNDKNLPHNTTTHTQDLTPAFDYESDNASHTKTPTTTTQETPSPEAAQLPQLPPSPQPEPKDPPSVLNNANINTANININVTNNSNDKDISNHNTTNFMNNSPANTFHKTTTTPKNTTPTIYNPYTKDYQYKSLSTPRAKSTQSIAINNTITPNEKPIAKTQTKPTNQPKSTNDSDESAALDELRKLMDEHIESDSTFNETQDSNTESTSQVEYIDRDITLETFYQYPVAAELTNKVTEELKNILPKITHNFNNKRKILDTEEEAANAALAWYHQVRTKNATENVAKAIEEKTETPSKTIQELIDDSINKSIMKTSNKIAKSVEQQIRKKSSGPTRDQRGQAVPTSTGQDSRNNINQQSSTLSTPSSNTTTPQSQDLLNTTTTPPNPSKIITWDDYLRHKHRKTQRMKTRNKRINQNAKNAKWKPPSQR